MSMPTKDDIHVGRVFMMNPGYLIETGKVDRLCTKNVNPLGGNSPHYFVCVDKNDKSGLWCPLSSNKKHNGSAFQGTIKSKYKNGFKHFLALDSWYDLGQIWRIPHEVAVQYAQYDECNKEELNGNKNAVFPVIIEIIFHGAFRDKLDKVELPGLTVDFSLKSYGLKP